MAALERKAVDNMVKTICSPTFSLALFADHVTNLHPTHQQTIMRAIMACIDQWQDMYVKGYYDLRNEGTVMASARMREALDQFPIQLPYV